jgi:Lrp/AsnC family leucine-responsive transcriptional regulator
MKFNPTSIEYDATDLEILELLQENCKQPLAAIGQKVGLSAPSVLERIHKLEEAGVVIGYQAVLDARKLGRDVTAFIGVATERARDIARIEREVGAIEDVLECHHVTGEYTLLLKVKTANTSSLERLISRIRAIEGVSRTETLVVLSTHVERAHLALHPREPESGPQAKRGRRNGSAQLRRA